MLHRTLFSQIDEYNEDSVSKNGVYLIYHNKKPNTYYIGSTFRKVDLKKCKNGCYGRWREHYSTLLHKKHHSDYLQNVVNKYGIDGLRFRVILNTDDKLKTRKLEKIYIIKYNSVIDGYNSSEETNYPEMSNNNRINLSHRMTINNPMKNPSIVQKSLKNRNYINKILQYSKSGIFIKEWINIITAAQELKIDSSNINRALLGEWKSSGGYIWIYKQKFTNKLLHSKISLKANRKFLSKETKLKIGKAGYKKVSCFLNGNLVKTYLSVKKAAEDQKIYASSISRAARGLIKKCNGYQWKYSL